MFYFVFCDQPVMLNVEFKRIALRIYGISLYTTDLFQFFSFQLQYSFSIFVINFSF